MAANEKEKIAQLRSQLAAEQRAAERCFRLYEREIARLKAKLDEKDRLLLESAKVLYKTLHG